MSEDMSRVWDVVGDNVDRILSLDFRPRGFSHGVIHPIFAAAREDCGAPLALTAAKQLLRVVKPGDVVLITTGAGNPLYLPRGETDGPLGAAALARVLVEGLGAVPIMLSEEAHLQPIAAAAVAAGLGLRDLDTARRVFATTALLSFPSDLGSAEGRAAELLDQLAPSAVIAIEKLGPNAAGVIHSATGMPMAGEVARVDRLVELARQRGILTIGVGDNGNEIGCGRIIEAVWEHKPFGRVCQCPCGQGLATTVATDVLVIAGTSNWGAYGIEACLAALMGRPELMHTADIESSMLHECVRAGGVDGSTGRQVLGVDGTPLVVQQAVVDLLRAVIEHGIAPPRGRPF